MSKVRARLNLQPLETDELNQKREETLKRLDKEVKSLLKSCSQLEELQLKCKEVSALIENGDDYVNEIYLTKIETHVKAINQDFKTILVNVIEEAMTTIKDQQSQARKDKRVYKAKLRNASTNNKRLKDKIDRVNNTSQEFQAQLKVQFNELQ